MKKTTLYNAHLALNAKMTPFGGYEMPVQYTGVKKEHLAVRESVGVFDVSHMGEFYVSGPRALDLLQYVCSNDISKIIVGKAQYNYFPNAEGGIVDDLIVYRLAEERYLLVVNASNIEKDWSWIQKHNQNFDAQIENHSDTTALLAIQGPKAIEAMQSCTEFPLASLPFYAHTTASFAGCENVLIATTGYTGAGGIEVYFPASEAETVWNTVLKAGAPFGIVPVGLAARDTLRTEMGYCLYGNEINDTTSPIAAGLGWVTKPETDFINSENIALQKKEGTPQKLIGFTMENRAIPRSGYTLVDIDKKPIGSVTSGTQSPVLSQGIGLGYVDSSWATPGTPIGVLIRDKFCPAQIVKTPFIKS
ncbi:glycine cleavage system aminomethyltransferase GcvT [Flavobacteriaceae bacterium]|jgi:aminomethyltransferase|nr:glycine cleavage system aminomethyltransferase GcvT [Flavobacteriaceae bacterium]MDC0386443.1 glycine cleavage system aminomethyltransferase GcvT [Flavobacteriaceae bacterium]